MGAAVSTLLVLDKHGKHTPSTNCVCCRHTNHYFYPTISVHPLSVLILHPREVRILWSQTARQSKPNNRSFLFDDVDVGSLFLTSVHAFVSNGWVQPSQPIPSPTLSSSMSWLSLTHAMPSLSPHHAALITFSVVAMLLLSSASKKNERKQE